MTVRKIAVAVTISGLGVGIWFSMKDDLRGTLSSLCEYFASEPTIASDEVREVFEQTIMPKAETVPGHTHPTAAGNRRAAVNFVRAFAANMGLNPFSEGMSKTDQRNAIRGSRQWYWPKDTHIENRHDVPDDNDLVYICDVDYYMDMPKYLQDGKPVVLYTCVPECATSVGEDNATFYFNEDGSLETLMSGGGRYNHKLWNYGFDSLIVKKRVMGIVTSVVTYAVERKQVAAHRQVVLLAPMKRFHGVGAFLAHHLLAGQELKRFNPIIRGDPKVVNGVEQAPPAFVRIIRHSATEVTISTARPSTFLSATVPADVDDAIAASARLGATALQIPGVESWIGPKSKLAAAVLTEYHRHVGMKSAPVVYPVSMGVRGYQYDPQNHNPDAVPKLEAFMSPIVHGSFAPVNDVSSEEQCVWGRIDGLKKKEPAYHATRDQFMVEFANEVVGDVFLTPKLVEDVEVQQARPAQKQSLARAFVNGPFVKRVLKCFIKAESYGNVKDPRNISTYNDNDKLMMSQYIMALADHMKKYEWYGPGKTPIELAARVAKICVDSHEFVNQSDLSRMDGTVTYTLRQIDRFVLMKAFPGHRAELNDLLKRNVDNFGRLPWGTTFEQESSHGSGCPGTSALQTLRNAVSIYLAFRNATNSKTGDYYTHREAFDALGVVFGDDAVNADLPISNFAWACERVGLNADAAVVHKSGRGVTFLARVYSPDVWTGGLNSMCDISRQLSKFHTTTRLPDNVKPIHKLIEKAMSFVLTDGNTPVLGELVSRALAVSSYRPKKFLGVGHWWAKYDRTVQYPNEDVGGWMARELELGIPSFDLALFQDWIRGVKTEEEMLSPPLCAEVVEPKSGDVDVTVDGKNLLAEDRTGADEDGWVTHRSRRKQRSKEAAKPKAEAVKPKKVRTKTVKTNKDKSRPSQKAGKPKTQYRVKVPSDLPPLID